MLLRRFILVFMMVLLPIQSSWAAMGLCTCEDELQGWVAKRGMEEMAPASHSVDEHAAQGNCEPSCQLCHFVLQVPAPAQTAVDDVVHDRPIARWSAPGRGHIPEGPDRPSWPLAA